jgi:hypothetical protein
MNIEHHQDCLAIRMESIVVVVMFSMAIKPETNTSAVERVAAHS